MTVNTANRDGMHLTTEGYEARQLSFVNPYFYDNETTFIVTKFTSKAISITLLIWTISLLSFSLQVRQLSTSVVRPVAKLIKVTRKYRAVSVFIL